MAEMALDEAVTRLQTLAEVRAGYLMPVLATDKEAIGAVLSALDEQTKRADAALASTGPGSALAERARKLETLLRQARLAVADNAWHDQKTGNNAGWKGLLAQIDAALDAADAKGPT